MNKTTKTEWTIGSSSWLLLDTSEIEDDYPGRTKEVFFVTAANDEGIVYSHFTAFTTQEAADALADRVRAAVATWAGPLNNPHWRYFRTEYGSPAYARNWREYQQIKERHFLRATPGTSYFEILHAITKESDAWTLRRKVGRD